MLMKTSRRADAPPAMVRVVSVQGQDSWAGLRGSSLRRSLVIEPMHLAAVGFAAIVLAITVKPLSETDLFWHVPLGQQILRSHHVAGAGTGWTIASGTHGWVSSEWLGEVGLAALRDSSGWRSILWVRLALALVLVLSTLWLAMRRSTARVAAVAMLAVSAPLALGIQERPQIISLILLVPTAVWADRVRRTGRTPRLLICLPTVFLWAQIHSLWLLLPGALALAAACRLLDLGRLGLRSLRNVAITVVALLIAGSLTPIGPRGLLLPLTLHSATSRIAEWQPTPAVSPDTWGLFLVVGLLVLGWSRSGRARVPMGELAFTGAMVVFAMLAVRNVLPATLLLMPLATRRLSTMRWARPGRVGAREAVILRRVAISATVGAAAFCAVLTSGLATFDHNVPTAIAHQLASEPGEHRVINAYNSAGALVAFGGPGIRVAIDGRADRWGATYVNGYLDALSMQGDWRTYLSQLHPTDAVLSAKAPIVDQLVLDGWTKQLVDHEYVLL